VIDPEDVVFRKEAVENAIELARRLSIAAERLLDDEARVCPGAPCFASPSATVANRLGGMAR